MSKIKLQKIKIPQSEISKLSNQDKKRLVMLSAMLRDLNFLQKNLLFVGNVQTPSEVELDAKETMVASILKNLISRIYEMHQFINNNGLGSTVKKSSNQDLKKKLKMINCFFSDAKVSKLFDFIRNKFGYHYEYKNDIDDAISKSLAELDYEMWLSPDNSANEIFPSLDKVVLNTICAKMKELGYEGNTQELFDKLFSLMVNACDLFRKFCVLYITIIFNFSFSKNQVVEIDAPLLSEVKLPFIVG